MEPLEDTLRRLKQERDEADRRYNDALTALDRALPAASPLPPLPIAIDDTQLDAINREWETVAAPQGWSGWRARLAGFIWRVAAPSLQRQQQFNARLVDHLNRQAAAARESDARARELVARLQTDLAGVAEFHARTIQYLQQVTAYIDTRDRDAASGALIVNAALSGLAENMDKRWESQTLREQRRDRHAADLGAQQDELRTIATLAQQATLAIRRELERLQPAGAAAVGAGAAVVPSAPLTSAPTFAGLDSYKYVGFEDQFRGSREAIRARLESYLPFFAGSADVLDVGCGRGEFLELLAGTGVSARGIDVNHEMVEVCRVRGLDVTEADAVTYLSSIEDGSLGGLFAAQVVEHLQPGYLLAFLDLAFRKLRPGSRLILETLNPACWVAFFDSFIRDITHVWPLHPDTLRYLVAASGFPHAEIEYRAPVAPEDRLHPIAAPADAPPALADLAETFNANVDKLNSRLFTHRDYAVIGTR
jgi:SAM-dependent methyltransferase